MSHEFAAPAPAQNASAPAWAAPEPRATAEPTLVARMGAELFGTFFLVLAICGVAMYTVGGLGPGVLGVALAGGIAVMAGIAAVGHVSGGHFNPAVTLGAAIAGRTAWINVPLYWLAQVLGGVLATLVLFATIPTAALPILQQSSLIVDATKQALFLNVSNGYDAHSPLAASTSGAFAFSQVSAFLIETVVVAVFVGVILGVTRKAASTTIAPIIIGLTLSALILVAAPFTNASLNPARSIASAVFGGGWAISQLWLFIVAPLLGAAIAGLFTIAFSASTPVEDDLLGEEIYTDVDVQAFGAEQAPVEVVEETVVVEEVVAAETPVAEEAATPVEKTVTDTTEETPGTEGETPKA